MKPLTPTVAALRARDAVRKARGLVVMPSPARMDEMLPSLEEAASELSALAEAVRSGEAIGRHETVQTLEQCAAELEQLRGLLNHAAAWHTAWARILAGLAGSYGPDGAARTGPPPVPRVSVTG